ncbi:PD-(D/E)XK motif protein [Streptomyces sp. SCUT-3]|uniref:PD-(D/E)XK motif protein n=1 Tax=Streptomyces sp. SCUT-3 TaxID=2684469 RepID=UPI000CA7320B|nr:PD-(D/E)XK motif protein [Streptomyces sp. SCUT-3]PLW72998.1 PD-(D/E)XK motif protein [Streptomyces sp. DJ]QMV24171.1 PD-(D/E)XK motif protein [Streptomyces sp. SCUT-3]
MIDEDLWRKLEIPQQSRGRSTRRLYPESLHDIHIGVTHPGRQRMLLVRAGARAADRVRPLLTELHETRGLSLSCSSLTDREFELQISLTAGDLREVFTPLAEDIARTAKDATPETVLEQAVRRYTRWQELMRSVGTTGLGKEARLGLYGELHYLRHHLMKVMPADEAVDSWTGAEGSNQDFQLPSAVAVEVKATAKKNPSTVRVTSERQLDGRGVRRLVLARLILDERRGGLGTSLNSVVAGIRASLNIAAVAARFETRLAWAGYLPHQRDLYDEPRYTVRRTDLWNVGDGFPRIVETDLPEGVGNCSYEISVSALEEHRTTTDEVIRAIRGTDG